MAKIIPKRTLDDIRFRCDIAEVIGSYLTLQRSGSSFKALCPFHKEKTPSFHVNPQRQIFHCFGCGAGGDVFSFIMQQEGMDFTDAVRMLAERAGVRLELEDGAGGGTDGDTKDVLYRIHSELADFYRRCLQQVPSAQHARDYLARRELGEAAAEQFMIGYAPDSWDAAIRWGHKHKYTTAQLEQAGVILQSTKPESSGRYYDRFRDRLMFPIRDAQSRVIAFSGRALREDDKSAKYVNSPETPLFRKSRVLYALEQARKPLVETREAIVCEGQIDVIRCHLAGFPTAVAAQGTAFTEEHARILNRYADSVVLVFDPDRAGQDAAIRTARLFMAAGLAVRVAALPPQEDPDSFLQKRGADAFRAVLSQAKSAVGFQIDVLSGRENLDTEVGVMRVAKAVLDTVTHSPNAVQRAKLVQTAADQLHVPASALTDDLRHLFRRRQRRGGAPDERRSGAAVRSGDETTERQLCEALVHYVDHPELVDLVRRYLPLELLQDAPCRALLTALLDAAQSGRDVQDVLNVGEQYDAAQQAFAAGVLMAPSRIREGYSWEEHVRGLILRLWERKLGAERNALRDQEGTEAQQRCRQITVDLKSLRRWDTGVDVLEMELG